MARDIYSEVTTRIVTALQSGTIPWRKPWAGGAASLPRNAITNKPYGGINAWLLTLEAGQYADQRFVTFKQAVTLGGTVRKGEHGYGIIYASAAFSKKEFKQDGSPKRFMFLKSYTVFNVEQCDGLAKLAPAPAPDKEFDAIAAAETIVAAYPGKPVVTHVANNDKAFYTPRTDIVTLPARTQFHSAEGYYETLFHELGHSTGAEKRLNRPELVAVVPFGSEVYSKEELVAEFTAAFLCAQAGIDNTLDNAAAYIKGWLKALADDPKLVVSAASKGQAAANLILGVTAVTEEAPAEEPQTAEVAA